MLKLIDRGAALLLALFSAGHGFLGTVLASPLMDPNTMWSFSGSVAAWLIAVLNWLRTGRPGDRVLAFWALVGNLAWIGLMIWLMAAADMVADLRPWLFVAVCVLLSAFSLRGLFSTRA